MTSRTRWIAASIATLLLVAGTVFAADPLPPFSLDKPKALKPAPDFTLPGNDGKKTRLQSLRGKVVVINFWATWCGPCVAELPSLKQMSDQLRGPRFTLLTVDVQEEPGRVQAFLQRYGMSLSVLYDEEGDVQQLYGVRGLPTTIVVDAAGNLVGRALGARQWNSPDALTYFRGLIGNKPAGSAEDPTLTQRGK